MLFKDKLAEYIELLDCTARDLSEYSGLSPATISRYRSGDRIPEAGSENFPNLVEGIVCIAQKKKIADITISSVTNDFLPLLKNSAVDMKKLPNNLNKLLDILPISVSELSRFLNYDASYISRIRNGNRQPANPEEFLSGVTTFVVRRCHENPQRALVADLIGCKSDDLKDPDIYKALLFEWLTTGSANTKNYMKNFLEKLDEFNLDEYIRAIHFNELKVPSVPFQLPTSKNYFGLKEMMNSELAFLKATVLSRSLEPVIMYSDMPMGEMAKDPDFPKKWMFGMAMMLKKGLHLNQIHNIDRSFEDMMLGLESWIPMYMTGQISPYYLKGTQDNVFSHFLKVSGSVALTGEAIKGYHREGKYYLTKNKEEVNYYKKRANRLLSKASPLMEIYREDHSPAYNSFLQEDAETEGNRYAILSSLSLHTTTTEFITRILNHNQIPQEEQMQIQQYISGQREIADKILFHSRITEEIPVLSKEELEQFPMVLPLSGMFYTKDIIYTWEDYQEHLRLIQEYKKQHSGYDFVENTTPAFRNIQICIHEKKWVMVSKNKTPAIHFLIRHPKMRDAFENMVIPVFE